MYIGLPPVMNGLRAIPGAVNAISHTERLLDRIQHAESKHFDKGFVNGLLRAAAGVRALGYGALQGELGFGRQRYNMAALIRRQRGHRIE
jgi:hypothetical protein